MTEQRLTRWLSRRRLARLGRVFKRLERATAEAAIAMDRMSDTAIRFRLNEKNSETTP